MTTHLQAHLYLSDQRGCTETAYARSFHTFTFGQYVGESREPFGSLTALNDSTLAAGYGLSNTVDQPSTVVVIPVVGGLEYNSSIGHGFVQSGQAQVFPLAPGMELTICNPYATDVIRFVQIWLATNASFAGSVGQPTEFDLSSRNTLLPFYTVAMNAADEPLVVSGFIGKFDGRRDGVYRATMATGQPSPGLFAFVLSGAFEVQNRLLEPGDGLALTNIGDEPIEFEALANDALILLLEIAWPAEISGYIR